MKSQETKYRTSKSNNLIPIISILMFLIIVISLIYSFIYVYNTPITEAGTFQSHSYKIFILLLILVFIFFLFSAFLGSIIGTIKSKLKIAKENKIIEKTNPYIYYRELPNNFGIGVTSLLFDSKLENYKDIVAVILDLCARKYLNLIKENDKYVIKVLKGTNDNLLNNEKYILSLIINNDVKNISYQEWYNYCMQDGINLGLYHRTETKMNKNYNPKDIIQKRQKNI